MARCKLICKDDVVVCNCASCGRLLLSQCMRQYDLPVGYRKVLFVYGRLHGRPYCRECWCRLEQ